MTTAEFSFSCWRTSSYSSGGDNCVEVAFADDAPVVGVRDSQHPDQATLAISPGAWVVLCRAAAVDTWR